MRLKIGLTQRVFTSQYGEIWDVLAQRWNVFVAKLGGIAIPIPDTVTDVSEFIEDACLTGVILTGGNNLVKCGGDAPVRDALETTVLEYVIGRDFPVIGVCRGLQVIHDYFGGLLELVEGHAGTRHGLVGEGMNRQVNSFHRYGFRETHFDLIVGATAEDGVIESVSLRGERIHGIMWHPERNRPFDPDDIDFFKGVFEGRL